MVPDPPAPRCEVVLELRVAEGDQLIDLRLRQFLGTFELETFDPSADLLAGDKAMAREDPVATYAYAVG